MLNVFTLANGRLFQEEIESLEELSRFQPIGLMIYNNALFMNAPLEVLVRRYREKVPTTGFEELVQVWPAFEAFLLNFKRAREDEIEHFQGMIGAELAVFADAIVTYMLGGIGKRKKRGEETTAELLARRVQERTAEAEARPLVPAFLKSNW